MRTDMVVTVEFTETALGRFMRAIELYVVLVYMLTISFHHLRHLSFFPIYRPATKGPSRSNTFERNSMDKSGEFITPKEFPDPPKVNNLMEVLEEQYRAAQAVQTVERNSARSATVQNAHQHQSMAVRLSTWLGVSRPQTRLQQPQPQPWDVDTERGPSPVAQTTIEPWYAEEKPQLQTLAIPPQPEIDEDEQRGVSPLPDFPPRSLPEYEAASPASSVHRRSYAAPSIAVTEAESVKTALPTRDWQEIEYSNAVRYSGVGEDVVAEALKQTHYEQPAESPMSTNIQVVAPSSDDGSSRPNSMNSMRSAKTASGGQYLTSPYPMSPLASAAATPLPRSRPLPPMPVPRRVSVLASPMSPLQPDSARSSNMSVLLREQNELDQSIEALRHLSPTKQGFDANPATQTVYYEQYAQEAPEQSARYSPAPSAPSPDLTLATPRPDRDAPQSSTQSEFYYDSKPPLNRSSMDSGVIPAMPAREADVEDSPRLAPPVMPISRFSDSSSVRRERKGIDSMGTQYDITSFVGSELLLF